jgi:hypothetical protein
MAKMFYTQAEAAAKLGKTLDQMKQMVRDGRLREFRDSSGPAYRIEDIDKLATATGAIPAAAESPDAVDLELVEETEGGSKEDTVITSAGISVFDDEDLQIEADPMAQTSITQSVEDQISLETTGSGSGLLDLTREVDETSLGAEVWDEINPAGQGAVETAEVLPVGGPMQPAAEPVMPFGAMPPVIEASDGSAIAFSAVAALGVLIAAAFAFVLTSISFDVWTLGMESASKQIYIWGGGALAVTLVAWILFFLVGRSMAGRA